MICEPLGPNVRAELLPVVHGSPLMRGAIREQGYAVRARVEAVGEPSDVARGDLVLVDSRQLVRVGPEALVPLGAILAKLG